MHLERRSYLPLYIVLREKYFWLIHRENISNLIKEKTSLTYLEEKYLFILGLNVWLTLKDVGSDKLRDSYMIGLSARLSPSDVLGYYLVYGSFKWESNKWKKYVNPSISIYHPWHWGLFMLLFQIICFFFFFANSLSICEH